MKKTILQRAFVSFILILAFESITFAEKTAKAVFDFKSRTISYYYDELPHSGDDLKVYQLTPDADDPSYRTDAFNKVISPLKAVFDMSFAAYRPQYGNCWFADFSEMTSIDGLQYLNISEAVEVTSMFSNCMALTSVDVSSFNTGKVRRFSFMFNECRGLKSLDLRSFDTSSGLLFGAMFQNCKSLESLDLHTFDTSSATVMQWMFYGCSSLKTLNLNGFDTSDVEKMKCMFYGVESLQTLDLSSFDTSSVDEMTSMFANCKLLKTIYVSSGFVTTSLTDPDASVFSGCLSLVGGNGFAYSSSSTSSLYAQIDGKDGNSGYFTDVNSRNSPLIFIKSDKKHAVKKYILNGQVVIERDNQKYDLSGRRI